jgi:hypothetical protein
MRRGRRVEPRQGGSEGAGPLPAELGPPLRGDGAAELEALPREQARRRGIRAESVEELAGVPTDGLAPRTSTPSSNWSSRSARTAP